MTLPIEIDAALAGFRGQSRFIEQGGVITDLDGTALLEREGRLYVADTVVEGLKALTDLGRPTVLNTLRFPLNVVRTFGREWSAITRQPMPLVSLNGAILGLLMPEGEDRVVFQELAAFPLTAAEIDAALDQVEGLLGDGLNNVIVFFYARDWRAGEMIWAPDAARVDAIAAKYRSAEKVISGPLDVLRQALTAQEICMLAVQIDIPEDRRMAYQHVNPNQFLTTAGVDKLSGAREAAARLGFELQESVGAGDTPMDRFLEGVGLALSIGPLELPFQGRSSTVRLAGPRELGWALHRLARIEIQSA